MKTLTIFTILLTLGISFSSFIVSRQLPELNKQSRVTAPPVSLRIHRQGSGVSLSWSASSDAASFRIERAYSEPSFFEPIDEIENSGSRTCRYKDESVFPGDVFYRIISVDADGNEQTSEAVAIKIRKHG